ncbi:MAG: NADH-ubiquinone oxidoreductase-F iron-sulfur binding region domain-containing protein [Candidatus Izemoplasmatales bacterium]|nr:NADH-ubiquinone oxidoreductase-F iron-sulfur binding region domain-containing protein [Candidatus Izemoplasmatales bacterium]MDD5293194.1 NADH-ubiquinone oxidoreductase-F iron-sulfur binding region domain-containing protein [Candidatus Izemoplasmatales bacterium]
MIEMKLISKRCGIINPQSIQDFIKHDGFSVLERVIKNPDHQYLSEIEVSRLRGRGGAGFPVATKINAFAKETCDAKYIIMNADEGEPGNFKDKYLMEKDPFGLIEGMVLVAYLTQATHGYIYLRGEYLQARTLLENALDLARKEHYLGKNIRQSSYDFDIEIRMGAGSYVCGEEFALIESIEGKPGRTRVKPPFPTSVGLFGKPTLIQNVETFQTIPFIIDIGGSAYQKIGTKSSTGTKLISLSGNVLHKGVYEVPFGIPIRTVIDELGGGMEHNRKLKMVQLGGACGPIIPDYMLDMIIDFERFEEFDSKTGAGAIIVMDDRFSIFDILIRIVTFFEHESCGKCTPCREGHQQLRIILSRFVRKQAGIEDMIALESLARVMHQTSLCGLGQSSPTAIISTLRYFRDDYIDRLDHLG